MRWMTISQVARQFGLRTSALRYYEEIGILPLVDRISGQRRYGEAVLRRLAVVQRARQSGFTLEEIRQLFAGFRPGVKASVRWQQLSRRKLAELDDALERITTMQGLLRRMENCRCDALDECGAHLLVKACGSEGPAATSPPSRRRKAVAAPRA